MTGQGRVVQNKIHKTYKATQCEGDFLNGFERELFFLSFLNKCSEKMKCLQ